MKQPLVTPRLRIRRFTSADVPRLVQLHTDPEVMRYITDGRPDDPQRLEHGL